MVTGSPSSDATENLMDGRPCATVRRSRTACSARPDAEDLPALALALATASTRGPLTTIDSMSTTRSEALRVSSIDPSKTISSFARIAEVRLARFFFFRPFTVFSLHVRIRIFTLLVPCARESTPISSGGRVQDPSWPPSHKICRDESRSFFKSLASRLSLLVSPTAGSTSYVVPSLAAAGAASSVICHRPN